MRSMTVVFNKESENVETCQSANAPAAVHQDPVATASTAAPQQCPPPQPAASTEVAASSTSNSADTGIPVAPRERREPRQLPESGDLDDSDLAFLGELDEGRWGH